MPPPEVWGPPTWRFLHCLAEQIQEDQYKRIGPQLYAIVISICKNLPCPDCSAHATNFFNKIKKDSINSKSALRNALFILHNQVNARKKKPTYPIESLETYGSMNLVYAFKTFVSVFHTEKNFKLMTDNLHRIRLLQHISKWLTLNATHFQSQTTVK
jgi:hypothetical protein